MTLIIAMADDKKAVLLADRRVSYQQTIVTDEYNKLTVFACEDARLAVAFTGLAIHGTFSTSDWLPETLSNISSNTDGVHSILAEFCVRAGSTFESLSAADRRVAFAFCGFVHIDDTSEPRVYVVSNYDNERYTPGTFNIRSRGAHGQPVVEVAGNTSQLPATVIDTLYRLLETDLAPSAVVRFAVTHLQHAARHLKSLNQIGERCNAAIVTSSINSSIVTTYHTPKNSTRAFGPNIVVAKHSMSLGTEVMAASILAGPDIRKQDPCWCGSGIKFKNCHMKKYGSVYVKLPNWRRPLTFFQSIDIGSPWPTGNRFAVFGAFE